MKRPVVPEALAATDVTVVDDLTVVTVNALPKAELIALPVTARVSAYRVADWVIKSPARISAREECRRNLTASQQKAPIAEPMGLVKESSTGHEFVAERFLKGKTLAAQLLSVAEKKDSAGFSTWYKAERTRYESLAQTFFVDLSLAADLKLCNVFVTPKGLVATDAWLADCSDRALKNFTEYHPERTFNHMVLQVADRVEGARYRDLLDWLTRQILAVDAKEADTVQRYSKKLLALRATYGLG